MFGAHRCSVPCDGAVAQPGGAARGADSLDPVHRPEADLARALAVASLFTVYVGGGAAGGASRGRGNRGRSRGGMMEGRGGVRSKRGCQDQDMSGGRGREEEGRREGMPDL